MGNITKYPPIIVGENRDMPSLSSARMEPGKEGVAMPHNSTDFVAECDRSPRLNEMQDFFSSTAAGLSGRPLRRPTADSRLMQNDRGAMNFISKHETLWGDFDPHYFSSIPYRLEEEARLGDALLSYARARATSSAPLGFYIMGSAEGTFARTLAEFGGGTIRTLSCSPNIENRNSFYLHGKPGFSTFFHGPFHKLNEDFLRNDAVLAPLSCKFDVILEDTTFQMYSANRNAQISFAKSHLARDGVLLMIEKLRQPDPAEYLRRELQKDHGFKARFFPVEEIKRKNEVILQVMNKNEVTQEELAAAVGTHFRFACMTWNSGNFYTIAASNSNENLCDFVSRLCEPCIPAEYVYTPLPVALSSEPIDLPTFRTSTRF